MSPKGWGVTLVVVGVAVLVVAGAADVLGAGRAAGFGWKQILGVIVGAVLVATGIAKARRSV